MNENTKIIINPTMAIMKKQKRERDQLERKTKKLIVVVAVAGAKGR